MTIASLYAVAWGLVISASLGWPFLAVFVLVAGPWLGLVFARRP